MPVYTNDNIDTTVADFASVLEKSFSAQSNKSLRVPFYMTSSYRKDHNIPGVSMLMNPQSVSFNQTKRITRKDTQEGTIFYHWTNRSGRNNDILTLDFTGQTGNINIRTGSISKGILGAVQSSLGAESGPIDWLNNLADRHTNVDSTNLGVKLRGNDYTAAGVSKLVNFLNLYSLTREPMIDVTTGKPVIYYISYSSPLFGNTFVTFKGHFNGVMSITDSADKPFSIDYSFSFSALSSNPPMDDIYTTVAQNLSYLFTNPLDGV
jgi:hypothetical protein